MEHHSNIVPWQLLCEEQGARLEYVELDGAGPARPGRASTRSSRPASVKLRRGRPTSRTCSARSTRSPRSPSARTTPARRCWSTARRRCRRCPVDVAETGADFYAFTGHKMLGPTGIGVLWARRELLEEMPPFMGGGSMISAVEDDHSTWAPPPAKFEAGTPAIAEAAGLGAAVDYLTALGMEAVRAHERELTAYALERLAAIAGRDGLRARATPAERGGLVSFAVEGIHPHDIAELCNREGGRDPRRPPLRAAADAPPRRARHRPRVVLRLQHQGRSRPPGQTRWRTQRRVFGTLIDGSTLYREYILDHYKNPRNFGELEPPRRRVPRPQPALRRRDGRPHPARRRPDRGPALPRPGLRDLTGLGLDHLRRAEGQDGRRGRRRSTATSSPRRSASSSPPRASSAACWR